MTADVVQFSTELKSDYISVSLKKNPRFGNPEFFTMQAVEQGHPS